MPRLPAVGHAPVAGAAAWVEIGNRGAVPHEVRCRFFEKGATAGKREGTGLGTYSAKLIIETLGGEIGFETSDAVDATRVFFSLPLA
jgi:sensor histidine kinase regulating citrate/malate metabolism